MIQTIHPPLVARARDSRSSLPLTKNPLRRYSCYRCRLFRSSVPLFVLTRRRSLFSIPAVPRARTQPAVARSSTRHFRTTRRRLVLNESRGMTVEKVPVFDGIRGSISGRRRVAQVFPLQEERYLAEGRPLVLLSSPTLEHQVVNVLGRGSGPWQVVEAVADATTATTTTRILLAAVFLVDVATAVTTAVGGVVQLPQALHHLVVR